MWFSDRISGLVRRTLQDDVSSPHILDAHKPVDYAVVITMPLALLTYSVVPNWRLGLISIALVGDCPTKGLHNITAGHSSARQSDPSTGAESRLTGGSGRRRREGPFTSERHD